MFSFIIFPLLLSPEERNKIDNVPLFQIPRLEGEVKIDGVLDELQYQKAFTCDQFYETYPGDNTPPQEKTKLFVFTTDKEFVIGVKCYDSHPGKIRKDRYRRDIASNGSIDSLVFMIDPYGESKQAYFFLITAMNDVDDGLYDSSSGISLDLDIIFYHATKIDNDGWSAEIAIPFSSIKFPSKEKGLWLLNFGRSFPRKDYKQFSIAKYDRNSNDLRNGWAYLNMDLKGIEGESQFHFMPSWVGSYYKEDNNGVKTTHKQGSLGLNFEWSPRSDTIFKATINPDFSQVEADDTYQKINNRYPVYISEKRPFFMEGAESFSAPISLFYSRNIVDPEFGLKFSYRGNKLGLFGIFAEENDVPAERFNETGKNEDLYWAMLRSTYALDEKGSFIGFFGTFRGFGGDSKNSVFSIDGKFAGKKLTLDYQLGESRTLNDKSNKTGEFVYTDISYLWNQYLKTYGSFYRISKDFRADAGYLQSSDRNGYSISQSVMYQSKKSEELVKSAEIDLSCWDERTTERENVERGYGIQGTITISHSLNLYLYSHQLKETYLNKSFDNLKFKTFSLSWSEKPIFSPYVSYGSGDSVLYSEKPIAVDFSRYSIGFSSSLGKFNLSSSFSHYRFGAKNDAIRSQNSTEVSIAYVWSEWWSFKLFGTYDRLDVKDYFYKDKPLSLNALLTYRINPFSQIFFGVNKNRDKNIFIPLNEDYLYNKNQVFVKINWFF